MRKDILDRFERCFGEVLNCVEEEGTSDVCMVIARGKSKEERFQIQLKLTKDEFDFNTEHHGEIDLTPKKKRKG